MTSKEKPLARIVFLHYACPPVVGGVETVLARQAEVLAGAGHRVSVLTGRGEAWQAEIPVLTAPEFDSRHPRVLEMKARLDQGYVPPEFDSFCQNCLRILQRELDGADWIIAHNVASLHKNLALTVALRRLVDEPRRPGVILWHHDFAWNSRRYAGELHAGYPWDLLRSAWPGAIQVTISEARKVEMCRLFHIAAGQVRVIPNGIDPAEFHHLDPETRRMVNHLGLTGRYPLLLTPVRLTRRKNLELGLQVLAYLVQKLPGVYWVVTGPVGAHNPENQVYLRQLVRLRKQLGLERNVVFLAESSPEGLSDTQIADFYRLADALLITSQEEGFGLPVIEAGQARLPIFCSDLPSLRALGGEWVTYFKLHDEPADIATRIVDWLTHDPVSRLRERIRAGYTWEAIYAQHLAPLLGSQPKSEVE